MNGHFSEKLLELTNAYLNSLSEKYEKLHQPVSTVFSVFFTEKPETNLIRKPHINKIVVIAAAYYINAIYLIEMSKLRLIT